ncbi:lipid asymmetry maintenance protein MlaB [Erwinia pyrifoliae]|uniref:lipid asymmetry maintenance protein MlaB n=1 Tax=Erwinia pyrifoliae TaxID=79967 RepID=UPI0001960EDB|nr:lipid asymmetry maintenance protein MlaB [Erwinia pyrifoliae]AUX74045.1 STAS domain-containing protein [Erwinia pyrifoliae]MCA8875612.1 lipid asymmetry maintenance protein MlaB [Erwinia pyrifoliae]MCT2385818.1 lipid asymmetry maintenance protein MlaB [Erwinia pyrifoliae]MCU8588606.1 lipid asymmetry maintenance protein MlaB [Erwinia pyrifoliae]CAX54099.1 Anti-sigma B factor antagonist [Erwinia pyrifoliae Ep1/96]
MNEQLRWEIEAGQLRLIGELERETLLPLWQQREAVMERVETIDVSALERVDSGGLALLVHLRQIAIDNGRKPRFSGVTDKLNSLITLYNLQKIIICCD